MARDPKYIFWDWHGVLGMHGFWYKSVQSNDQLRLLATYAFSDKRRIDAWMRGDISIEKIISLSGARIKHDDLAGYFTRDWGSTGVINVALFSAIKGLYPDARHVIVTDNMDVFDEYAAKNSYLSKNFDGIYSSSVYGVLKGDEQGLFELVKSKLHLDSFEECFLFDDSVINCDRFRSLGGLSFLVESNRS